MEKGKKGENYIIANEFIPYIEMFNKIALMLNANKINKTLPRLVLLPCKLVLGFLENIMLCFNKKPILSPASIGFSFKHRYFDSSKIRDELGWNPKFSFEATMQEAIIFYKENNLI